MNTSSAILTGKLISSHLGGEYRRPTGLWLWKSVSKIMQSAPIKQRRPMSTLIAAHTTVPLIPVSAPIFNRAPGAKHRNITGPLTPSAVPELFDVIVTRSSREM
jgi:hypothetical protein